MAAATASAVPTRTQLAADARSGASSTWNGFAGQPPTHCMRAPLGLTDGVKSRAIEYAAARTRLHVQIKSRSSVVLSRPTG